VVAIEKLRGLGIKSDIDVVIFDVSTDEGIQAAFKEVTTVYKKLDSTFN
jgi:hypothetical protein